MNRGFPSIQPRRAPTSFLQLLHTVHEQDVEQACTKLADRTWAHVLFRGAPGSGKSHLVELVARHLVTTYNWRIVRLCAPNQFLQGLQELIAAIDEQDAGVTRMQAAPVPTLEHSVERLVQHRHTSGRPLLLVIDDLPGLTDRALRDRASIRGFVDVVERARITLLATSTVPRVGRHAKPLHALFHEIEIEDMTPVCTHRLLERHAQWAGHANDSAPVQHMRALTHLVGGNPRLITMLYRALSQDATRGSQGALDDLLDALSPYYRARLDALSAQQGLVLTRIALSPGPTPAARLGRQCGLPTSHTTAILDVLLSKRLVLRVPGPGKRSVYALADRLMRLWIVSHDPHRTHIDTSALLGMYHQAYQTQAQTQAFCELGRGFSERVCSVLAPDLGDVPAALRALTHTLSRFDRDQGNRVLIALLDQPPSACDYAEMQRSTAATPGDTAIPSAPERAVSHVAMAAHLIHTGHLGDAVIDLEHALSLAPNWNDLTLTGWLVALASVHSPDTAPAGRFGDDPLSSIAGASAHFFADPAAVSALHIALSRTTETSAPLWYAIAICLPRTDAFAERAIPFFDEVADSAIASAQFLGVAAAYAFERGRWRDALRYIDKRNALEPIPESLWPAWAWLAAQSGDVTAYVARLRRLESIDERPPWSLFALSIALQTADDPQAHASTLAPLFETSNLSSADIERLFGGLFAVRDRVSPIWLGRAIAVFTDLSGSAPEPYRWFGEFVSAGEDSRTLRTLHPEIRDAVELLWNRAMTR